MQTNILPYNLKENGYSVLCYGGHEHMISVLQQLLPGIRLLKSTRRGIDTTSFWMHDLIIAFPTNISHASCAAVKQAARRANVKYRTMVHKGAETAAEEILESLGIGS